MMIATTRVSKQDVNEEDDEDDAVSKIIWDFDDRINDLPAIGYDL